jgi:nucleotide-binding universal stress UspA family protein
MTIAHATALSPEDQPVFEHALALACAADARLLSVNAQDGPQGELPDAAGVLTHWGRPVDCVEHESMLHQCCDDPVDTLLDALRRVAPDLIVAGTHQRAGASRLLSGSQCEALLRNVTQPTLVFPLDARPFVTERGVIDLRRIVIPIGDEASARAAIERASWLAEVSKAGELTIELVFVGNDADAPQLQLPRRPGWTVHMNTAKGSIEDAILAASSDSCVIVMATRGPDSLKDSLFGTNTEHVLRHAKCPVLVTRI